MRHLQIATANTAKNPPKSTPILLSTAIVDRASGLRIPRCPGTRLGQQRRQGSAAGRAWHASGRLGRRAPSAAAQERVANPGSRAHGPGSSGSAPPGSSGSSQHHRARAVVAGEACGLPEGHGPLPRPLPDRAPAPRSPLTSLARVPQACAAGCCCWLLAAGCWRPPRPAGGTCGPAAP